MMSNLRAIWHEAGHVVVAKNFDLSVISVSLNNSIPTTCIDMSNASLQSQCVVYAGGVAAEKHQFNNCDWDAATSDRSLIEAAGGGKLESYLDYATDIIRANCGCLKDIVQAGEDAWISEESATHFSGSNTDKLNFELLNAQQIDAIWNAYH
jgi:hypothetical protein